jgi:hypothetical protein
MARLFFFAFFFSLLTVSFRTEHAKTHVTCIIDGPSKSGKTTLLSLLALEFGDGSFLDFTQQLARNCLRRDAIRFLQHLLYDCDRENLDFLDFEAFESAKSASVSNLELLLRIWDCKEVQKTWKEEKCARQCLNVDYIMSNLARFSNADFEVTREDVLRADLGREVKKRDEKLTI